jgi:lipopolysaccharide/colanic/teichoic acid biosynthesis glycosyltransferase
VAKRCFDFVMAIVLLVLCIPLFAFVALAIKLDSRGPVLFFQKRYGFNQQSFRIVKFRTMTSLDDGAVVQQGKAGDVRITRVGRVLRRLNIDELPQWLNVVQGRMSLVGPRPHALARNKEFKHKIALYARRHNVKPGITGWAQVNGLRGETDTNDKMARRVVHDLWYINNWSFWSIWRSYCARSFRRRPIVTRSDRRLSAPGRLWRSGRSGAEPGIARLNGRRSS